MSIEFTRYLNIRSAIDPVLSPDGKCLAFLSDITGNYQAWSVALSDSSAAGRNKNDQTDGWPYQLTFLGDKVWELHGTPAADHLIAVGDVGGNENQQFYRISNYGVDQNGYPRHDVDRLSTDSTAIHRFGAWSKLVNRIDSFTQIDNFLRKYL